MPLWKKVYFCGLFLAGPDNGALAHQVERFVRNEEVGSSSLLCSTKKEGRCLPFFIGDYIPDGTIVVVCYYISIINCFCHREETILFRPATSLDKIFSPAFLLIEKLTKDQADMNAARSVRPLTAAIHAASAPHVGLPARVLYGEVFRRNTILITPYKASAAIWGTG